MTITRSPYINNPDILFCHEARKTRPVVLDFGEAEMLPAGTLISCDGKAVNDVTALGVLLYDTWKGYGSGMGDVLISGHVDLAKAQEHCGLTYAAEAKAAMKQVCFVGDTEVPTGGGGGEYFETISGDTLTWDGNMDGKPTASLDMGEDDAMCFVKVSDVVPTIDDLSNGVTATVSGMGSMEIPAEETMTGDGYINAGNAMFVVSTPNTTAEEIGLTFAETGTYLLSQGGVYVSELTINGYTGFTTTKLKEEYVPNTTFNFTLSQSDSGIVCDKTYDEFIEAIESGKTIKGKCSWSPYQLTQYFGISREESYPFIALGYFNLMNVGYKIDNNSKWNYFSLTEDNTIVLPV